LSAERALSFGSVAEDYEATRPGWPLEPFAIAFEQFEVPRRPAVVDVAAGTGKLTRTLAELAGTLVAVEPDPALRAVLMRELPAVTAVEGTAETLPLEEASADAVCAGQAFHWFDVDRALDEFARVLRPGGIAIAAWNTPPEEDTWYDAVIDFLESANPDHLPASTIEWPQTLAAHPRFGGLLQITARHEQPTTRASFERLLGTHSILNMLPAERRSGLIARALAVADGHGAFDSDGSCAIPWCCEVFALRRLA
jgi:SAM-dependent methyltransferase